jgi:hypothetical protein
MADNDKSPQANKTIYNQQENMNIDRRHVNKGGIDYAKTYKKKKKQSNVRIVFHKLSFLLLSQN